MICTYYIDVEEFDNEDVFRENMEKLSPYRQQKIALLKHHKDKCRSLGAGVALAHALLGYGLREREMEYEIGTFGKPSLRYYEDIHFSLSHSGNYAICSIGDREVGNDVEFIKEGRMKVADRFFTEEELRWVYAVEDQSQREERMFRIWTIKESFMKVTGRGMNLSLRDFSVLMEQDNRRIKIQQSVEAKYFHVKEYDELQGYRVAVCCKESKDIAYNMLPVIL